MEQRYSLENIRKVLQDTNVDLHTIVMNNKESDDIFRAFFKAGVPEMGTPTDLALAETLTEWLRNLELNTF